MKKIITKSLSSVAVAASLLLPAVGLGATLTFDRQLDVGGIAVVSGMCTPAQAGGHLVYDLVQNGATVRLNTVGNIVLSDGSFNSYIKIPDNSLTGSGTVVATCPDGTTVSSAVTLQPFVESVPLPGSVFPEGGVAAGGGGLNTASLLLTMTLLLAGVFGSLLAMRKTA